MAAVRNGTMVAPATEVRPASANTAVPAIKPFAPSAVLNAFGMKAMQIPVNASATNDEALKILSTHPMPTGCNTRSGDADKVANAVTNMTKKRARAESVP